MATKTTSKKTAARKTDLAATPTAPAKSIKSTRRNFSGEYEAAYNSRFREMYGSTYPRSEKDMLPYSDRVKLIAWLRQSVRNDSRVSAIVQRYAIGIGTPTARVNYADPATNDKLERYLEHRFSAIRFGAPRYASTLRSALLVAITETVIGGEVFVIFLKNGQIQIVPSEYCGSPSNIPANSKTESNGILYNRDGSIKAYRFGRRVNNTICFDTKNSTVIPAEYVHHLGTPTRAEEDRFTPKLAPAMCAIQDLREIVTAKTMQIKTQASFSMAIKKNIAPEIAAEMADSYDEIQDFHDEQTARSAYKSIAPNSIMYLETGEDVVPLETRFNAADFDKFLEINLDFVCSVLSIPAEEAVFGYRRSNYSSARADKMRWKDKIDVERAMWTAFLDRLQYWQINRGILLGEISDLPPDFKPQPFIDWTFPHIREIDETKAAAAQQQYLQNGLKSKADLIAELGRYADEVDAEIVADAARMAKLVKEKAAEYGVSPEEVAAYLPKTPNTQILSADKNAKPAQGVDA